MSDFGDVLGDGRLVAILRGVPRDTALEIADRVWSAGAGVVEVPVQDAAALDVLAALAHEARARGAVVGAGTVVSTELVERAVAAGAAFTVAPGFDPEVAAASARAGLPHLPGVATASEVQAAGRAGCAWLKAFPAGSLGASWFKELRGPFPDARFAATGGVTAANLRGFLDAGARAVGIGSAVSTPEGLAEVLAALDV
ncbi:2-dehydro-3-deoxyphosphogluconate aldolase/(4S)-4-hydroxy-2-oxoglutarate aldolase [Motilibacter peucedani]|uniref:2-dehydro-3-deoxyphosphogluconate aldolase/(4S)-4-hydroxy-2-oxoglutarate aldolase n=1 Tax=Motilibacter peucedani TaxID=598650 RepID=A0A420XQB0_9ACTN|nr:bifunctional 4-hydroxy-2-oxoglutarate aldolase/2-dehydro-3-deoxy-phosphogluconate aldolase [Motilibacter peucedani]RKS75434.1 2-dehydro-3-deoxyphosphogluconate aldolase/(4S)-4-hydroxy-2-oxoglutarate aldolase [Motilibacter peucedani]